MKLADYKKLYVCSIKELYEKLDRELPDEKTIAILLTMENADRERLCYLDAVYRVEVMDTRDFRSFFAFNYIDGLHVKKFIEENADIGTLYVCCDSGESRSTALAAAILRYFGRSDMGIWKNPHYHPNTLVYSKQMLAFGKRVCKMRLKYLEYVNRRAFRRAHEEYE